MASLIVRDPFEFVGGLNRAFDRFLQEPAIAGGCGAPSSLHRNSTIGSAVHPLALDIVEGPSELAVHASLPGFRREDISVEVDGRVLTIAATRAEEKEAEGQTFHLRERRGGSFSRRVELPQGVQSDQARAELKDGVLTLTFPKAAGAVKRSIPIH
jgi:HSP20 family protein